MTVFDYLDSQEMITEYLNTVLAEGNNDHYESFKSYRWRITSASIYSI